jgi:hypothetical protein
MRRITSYINNLHPKEHKPLYEVIERIIELTIPLWNQTLSPLKSPALNPARIEYSRCLYDPDRPCWLPNEIPDDYLQRLEQWERGTRGVVRPEPKQFAPPSAVQVDFSQDEKYDERRVDLKRECAERGLQIIVKLANIHLTPEKPNYGGGTWHVEGQLVRVHPIFFYLMTTHGFLHRMSIFVPLRCTIMMLLI